MTAEGVFRVDERADALLVPNAALRFVPAAEAIAAVPPPPAPAGDGGASRVVWVADGDGQPRPVRIQIGITDGRVTEVVGGELAAGDAVITAAVAAAPGEERPAFGRFL
jgi:HlyD family secretion protein